MTIMTAMVLIFVVLVIAALIFDNRDLREDRDRCVLEFIKERSEWRAEVKALVEGLSRAEGKPVIFPRENPEASKPEKRPVIGRNTMSFLAGHNRGPATLPEAAKDRSADEQSA